MTPGEFFAILRGKLAEVKRVRRQVDQLNAKQCLVIARCAGNDKAQFSDFLTFPHMGPVKTQPPEVLEKKLMMIGGHTNGL